MSDEDLQRIGAGPHPEGWDPFEALLCRFADELHRDNAVTDATWAGLAAQYDDGQMLHALMLVGYYHLVSMVLNGARVGLEPQAEKFAPAFGD